MVNSNQPMLEFHSMRQYMSMNLAWHWDMKLGGDGTAQDLRASEVSSITELPIMEAATVAVWRALGERPIWVPRAITVAVWTAGAAMLFFVLRRLRIGDAGVLMGVVTWTLHPFVITATRSFQPDPLMVTAIVGAIWAIIVDDERQTVRSLVVASVAVAAAVLTKTPAVFFVVPVYAALAWRRGGGKAVISWRSACFAAGALGPALAYNVIGRLTFMQAMPNNFIYPHLLREGWFWDSWYSQIATGFGPLLVILALGGIAISGGRGRVVGASFLVGYVAYGVVFTWTFATHSYYHLPLVVAIAIGVALLIDQVVAAMKRRGYPRPELLAVVGSTVVALIAVSSTPYSVVPRAPSAEGIALEVTAPAAIGEATNHSDRVIYLTWSYGRGLAYYGSVSGVGWPQPADLALQQVRGIAPISTDERLAEIRSRIDAEYFAVIDQALLEDQPDLEAYLHENFPILSQGDNWIVFDLREG